MSECFESGLNPSPSPVSVLLSRPSYLCMFLNVLPVLSSIPEKVSHVRFLLKMVITTARE